MVLVYEKGAEFVFGVLGRAYTALSLFACVFLFIVEAAHLHYQMQIIIISGPCRGAGWLVRRLVQYPLREQL